MSHIDESVEMYLASLSMPNSEPTNLTTDPRTDPAAALAYASCMAWESLPHIEPDEIPSPTDAEWYAAQVEVLKALGWALVKVANGVLVNVAPRPQCDCCYPVDADPKRIASIIAKCPVHGAEVE